jgi:hypothetical protein
MAKERWMCRFCGRDQFTRPYQPHNCRDGFTKNWKKIEKIRNDNKPTFIKIID